MSLLVTAIIVLIVVCLIIWAVQSFMPGDVRIKMLIIFLVIIVAVIWFLNAAGIVSL